MSVITLSVYCTVFITTVFIQFAWSEDEKCCIRCPRAMDINKFNRRVSLCLQTLYNKTWIFQAPEA